MRTYNLFIIKKEYYLLYKNKSYVLYQMLEKLRNIKTYDFSYGIHIYKEICLPFSVKLLNNYIENKINYQKINNVIKIKSSFETTYLEIHYTRTIIKTNVNFPQILKIFNIYNHYIFVCDFKEKDYFFLNEYSKKTTLS